MAMPADGTFEFAATTVGRPVSPSTTRDCLMASAITWSLLGRASSLARRIVEIAKILGRHLRRHAIGFGKDDVEADDDGAEFGQARDQVGDARARPRPLAERLQAFLVDIDDDDRPLLGDARLEHLKEVEGLEVEFPRSAPDR